jgi:hypothetical protein
VKGRTRVVAAGGLTFIVILCCGWGLYSLDQGIGGKKTRNKVLPRDGNEDEDEDEDRVEVWMTGTRSTTTTTTTP